MNDVKLELVSTERFDNVLLDIYGGDNNVFYMTREEVGQALEYSNPKKAIEKIHLTHSDRFSGTPQSGGYPNALFYIIKLPTFGGIQDTIVYTLKGVMELCRWSHQPKANAFMDWVWDIMEKLLRGELVLKPPPKDYLEACGVIKPSTAITDKEVAEQFLQAIEKALESGEYYLYAKYSRKRHNGILLGMYDDTIITLISSRAYEIYAKATNVPVNISSLVQILRPQLNRAGLLLPRTRKDEKQRIKHTRYCTMRIPRQAANAISGFIAPALLAGG